MIPAGYYPPEVKEYLKHILKIILFYLIFFFCWRLVFLFTNRPALEHVSLPQILPAFAHGIRMDIAVLGYVFLIPALIFIIFLFTGISRIYKVWYRYHQVLILLLTLLLAGNILVFHFWGSMINYRALTYLSDPAEIFVSLTALQVVVLIAGLTVAVWLEWKMFRLLAGKNPSFENPVNLRYKTVIIPVMSGILVLAMRGGLQLNPMNESTVYYSPVQLLNMTALNPAWHLAYDIHQARLSDGNLFNTIPEQEARQTVNQLFRCPGDSFPEILSNRQPNIVILILESFTADLIGEMGGKQGVTPVFDQLICDGLLFSNIYSSGSRTDQGIVSVLNGFPATPFHSIMRSMDKSSRLPSLIKELRNHNYRNSFYYGGENNFSNLDAYLINQGFDRIIDERDFPSDIPQGRWGVYDEYVLDRQIRDLNTESPPFVSVLMTLSNHEPFDVPGPKRIPGKDEAARFLNSAAYMDACLGEYFRIARNTSWYGNTLFILVADHGHQLPFHRDEVFPNSRHIPILLYGDVLKHEFKDTRNTKLGGHHDIPATLMPQLGLPASGFSWSKNLLNPTAKDFAYYQVEQVLGWIEGKDWFAYSYAKKDFVVDSTHIQPRDTLFHHAQSFVQELYNQYRNY